MLPSYFDYIFVHLKQKVRLRPEISTKFLLTLCPKPARTQTRPKKPGPTHNSELQFVRWPVSTGTSRQRGRMGKGVVFTTTLIE